jgi:predicted Fe-Mo cluster-binding NifX family protein
VSGIYATPADVVLTILKKIHRLQTALYAVHPIFSSIREKRKLKHVAEMKIAITSTGNNTSARIDRRFGRCSYFVIYDTQSRSIEYIPNPNIEAIEGAGPASAELVASRGVTKVISGEFGAKVKSIFDKLKIQLIIISDFERRINQILELLDTRTD